MKLKFDRNIIAIIKLLVFKGPPPLKVLATSLHVVHRCTEGTVVCVTTQYNHEFKACRFTLACHKNRGFPVNDYEQTKVLEKY